MAPERGPAATDLGCIDALGPGAPYRTRSREAVTTVAGETVAELSLVPPLYVSRTITAQRHARPLPVAQRRAGLAAAAEAFTTAVIAGLDFPTYVELASGVSGLPIRVTRAAAARVSESVGAAWDGVRPAQPAGSTLNWRDERIRHGGAVWARRGEVFAVHAAGNSPGVHALWPQALALGYRIAVRPSRREPFTAQRLILALQVAGFRPEDVTYLPTDHRGADAVINAADLAMVYGDQSVVDKYATDPTVFANGPGRAKTLITADQDWREHLDIIVDSIADLAGMACVNTTAVLYEGDPAPLASAIAGRLSALKPYPATDERAVLPTQSLDKAQTLAQYLAAKAAGTTIVLGADQVVADLGDGSAALRPAVHLLGAPDVDKLNVELPFPCVWVSGWSRADGIAPLRQSLVVSAFTDDDALIDQLLADSTVANVYCGRHRSYHEAPEIPHDGFLADFLMRNKGFIRD